MITRVESYSVRMTELDNGDFKAIVVSADIPVIGIGKTRAMALCDLASEMCQAQSEFSLQVFDEKGNIAEYLTLLNGL